MLIQVLDAPVSYKALKNDPLIGILTGLELPRLGGGISVASPINTLGIIGLLLLELNGKVSIGKIFTPSK